LSKILRGHQGRKAVSATRRNSKLFARQTGGTGGSAEKRRKKGPALGGLTIHEREVHSPAGKAMRWRFFKRLERREEGDVRIGRGR